MSNSQIKGKANQFHSKIRRQKIQVIFKQKRSKQLEKNVELNRIKGQVQNELNRKFKDQKRVISQQHSTNQVVQVWNHIQQKLINKKLSFVESSEKKEYQQMMRNLCNLVSLAIKELNDYNDYDKHKLLQVINAYKQSNGFDRKNLIQIMLMERLQTLWSIFEESGEVLAGFFEKATNNKTCNELITSDDGWFWYLEWCNLMVEITYLKMPHSQQHFDSLITEYKQLNFFHIIADFTAKLKQSSLTVTYPLCINLIQSAMKSRSKGQKNTKKELIKDQKRQEENLWCQSGIELVQFVLGLFYVLGNIISDYQPISLQKTFSSLNFNNPLINTFNDKNRLNQLKFGLEYFENILIHLEMLRYQQFQRAISFSYIGNEQNYVQIATITYRDYIDLVQIELWFCRLLVLGGWLNINSTDPTHQYTINSVYSLIMTISLQSISHTVNLIDRLQIKSEQYIRKAAQNLSELILIYQLCLRQCLNDSYSLKQSSQTVSKLNKQFLQLSSQRVESETKAYQIKNPWIISDCVKGFVDFVVRDSLMKVNTDLNLLNQIWIDLINLYESMIVYGFFDINNCEELVNFIIQCSRGEIISSSVLSLPILVIKITNNPDQLLLKYGNTSKNISNSFEESLRHLRTQFIKHLSSFVYVQFVKSLQSIVPIFVYNKERMIEQDSEFKKTGKYNPQFMAKIYAQSKSFLLKYFIENLSMRKQEEFYSNFISMLSECFSYHQNGVTHHMQQNLVKKGNLPNITMNIQSQPKISSLSTNKHDCRQMFEIEKELPDYLTAQFMNKMIYFIVDEVSRFDKTSAIHLKVLRLLRMMISSFSSQDEEKETLLKHLIEYNVHGIKECLEDMALWESSQVNEQVVTIFQLLEIQ